jgi:D-threo-aldose 1-dehydrogenase
MVSAVSLASPGVSLSGVSLTVRGGERVGITGRSPAGPSLLARARRMRDACARYDVPLAAAALRFTLRHPAVTAAVVGARTAEEITRDVSYLSGPIPDALRAELEAL